MLAWGAGWEAFRVLSAFVIGQEHAIGPYLADLSRSAKVSSARATGLSHLSSQKGSDLGQETFFLDQWSLWVSVCGVVDLEVKLGVRCRATHRSGLIHVSLILDNVCIADARFAGFPSGIIR